MSLPIPQDIKPTLATVKDRLKPFLDLNQNVPSIEECKDRKIRILNPWGDKSIVLNIPADLDSAEAALNHIFLPQLYSAIWHQDTHDLEFIYTVMAVKAGDISHRKFTFKHKSNDHICEFSAASPRLLKLIELADVNIAISNTDCRNLIRFKLHDAIGDKHESIKPISFWVRNIREWDDDKILQIVTHLNFYMKYYDTKSPYAQTHYPINENTHTKIPQFRKGKFPDNIISREISDNILHLWNATLSADSARKFLYSYMIVEHVSTFYMKETAVSKIRKIISEPDILDDLGNASEQIISAILASRIDDFNQMLTVIESAGGAEILWKETRRNTDVFTKDIDFVGGFHLKSIFDKNWTTKKEYEKSLNPAEFYF